MLSSCLECEQCHFLILGEFGSERLVQKVVDTILRQTKNKEEEKKDEIEGAAVKEGDPLLDTSWRSDTPTKIILTGHKVLQSISWIHIIYMCMFVPSNIFQKKGRGEGQLFGICVLIQRNMVAIYLSLSI